jgi:prepilin-type N-terminal cleavage/methylation domain-containing protein
MAGPLAPRRESSGRETGFSFIEVLVVMGIIAVLVGMGVVISGMLTRRAAEVRSDALLAKMRANADVLRGRFGAYPPSDLNRLPRVSGLAHLKIGAPTPQNVSNWGIESLYQGLRMPGVAHDPDLADTELSNHDRDALDRPLAPGGDAALYEVKDAWENPLVYFVESDYATAEKDPPVYINAKGEAVSPRPYRTGSGTGFAQPNAYQLYSMGPDNQPNTEDDRLAWDGR